MTTVDFDNVGLPVRGAGGAMITPVIIDENYVTLWRHKPSVTEEGVEYAAIGTIGTKQYPGQDKSGLLKKAGTNGWFTWPPDQPPSREAMSLYDRKDRELVRKLWESVGANTETRPTEVAEGTEVLPPPPPPAVLFMCLEDDCDYSAPKKRGVKIHFGKEHKTRRKSKPAVTQGRGGPNS